MRRWGGGGGHARPRNPYFPGMEPHRTARSESLDLLDTNAQRYERIALLSVMIRIVNKPLELTSARTDKSD